MSPATNPVSPPSGVNPLTMDPASLLGTLSMMGLMGPSQAALDAQNAGIHQQVQEATDQLNQAGQQYRQAATQPSAELPPGANFAQNLLGNTASVLTQNPMYAQQAHEHLTNMETKLMQQRLQNMQSLKDEYDRRAMVAEHLGQAEIAMKARQSSEQIAKGMLAGIAALKGGVAENIAGVKTGSAERIAAGGNASKEKIGAGHDTARIEAAKIGMGAGAGTGAAGAAGGNTSLDPYVTTTRSGARYLNADIVPPKQKTMITQYLKDNPDAVPLKTPEVAQMNDIESARQTNGKMLDQLKTFLPPDWQSRPEYAAKTWGDVISQAAPLKAAFDAFQLSAPRDIRAVAGPRGMRMSEPQMKRTIHSDIPSIYDTLPVAMQRIANLNALLDTAEAPIMSRNWAKTPEKANVSTSASDYVKSLGLKK